MKETFGNIPLTTGTSSGGQKRSIHLGYQVAFVILMLIIWLDIGQVVSNDRMLSITVKPEETQLHNGDSVVFDLELKNISNRYLLLYDYVVDNGFSSFSIFSEWKYPTVIQTIFYDIVDSSGTVLSNGCYINNHPPNIDDFILLAPGEVKNHKLGFLKDCYQMDNPGIYEIQLCYYNNIDPGTFASFTDEHPAIDLRRAWKGKVCSFVMQLEILSSTSQQNLNNQDSLLLSMRELSDILGPD